MVFNKITELIARLRDGVGNSITSTDLGDGKRGLDISGNITATVDKARIRDATDANKLLVVDSNGNIGVVIFNSGSAIDPRAIRALTSSDIVSAIQSGTWNINNISGTISLPTGAATSAKQDLTNTKLDTIDTDIKAVQPRKIQGGDGLYYLFIDTDGSIKVKSSSGAVFDNRLKDATNAYYAKVDSSGNIYTVTPAPETPAGKTSIHDTKQGDVSGSSDSFTVIPSGQKVIIQRMKAGSELDTVAGCKVELYYAPNGNTTGIVLIEAEYVNGNSAFVDLNYESPVGDGTKAILMRRARLGGSAVEIFGKWEGYY